MEKTIILFASGQLANCIINADFYGKYGIIIKKESKKITIANPGYIRLGKEQMRRGGLSDPRNKLLMKMFNMIDIGEHAGSGVPNIYNTWEDEGWEEPVIIEEFDPDRTTLILSFEKRNSDMDDTEILADDIAKSNAILEYCKTERTRKEIAEHLGYKTVKSAKKYIDALVENGLLGMTVPDKPSSPLQKYYSK